MGELHWRIRGSINLSCLSWVLEVKKNMENWKRTFKFIVFLGKPVVIKVIASHEDFQKMPFDGEWVWAQTSFPSSSEVIFHWWNIQWDEFLNNLDMTQSMLGWFFTVQSLFPEVLLDLFYRLQEARPSSSMSMRSRSSDEFTGAQRGRSVKGPRKGYPLVI